MTILRLEVASRIVEGALKRAAELVQAGLVAGTGEIA